MEKKEKWNGGSGDKENVREGQEGKKMKIRKGKQQEGEKKRGEKI